MAIGQQRGHRLDCLMQQNFSEEQTYSGSCHCGGVSVEYTSQIPPQEIQVRECQCRFCRVHGGLAVSDINGHVRFTEHRQGILRRYRFAKKTCDFLLCNECGVYMGAVMQSGDEAYGIVNTRVLDRVAEFTKAPVPVSYDVEDTAGRQSRRRTNWTPAWVKTTD